MSPESAAYVRTLTTVALAAATAGAIWPNRVTAGIGAGAAVGALYVAATKRRAQRAAGEIALGEARRSIGGAFDNLRARALRGE